MKTTKEKNASSTRPFGLDFLQELGTADLERVTGGNSSGVGGGVTTCHVSLPFPVAATNGCGFRHGDHG